jgi:hypothetical protein
VGRAGCHGNTSQLTAAAAMDIGSIYVVWWLKPWKSELCFIKLPHDEEKYPLCTHVEPNSY